VTGFGVGGAGATGLAALNGALGNRAAAGRTLRQVASLATFPLKIQERLKPD
jgi:hypothetical protein